MGIIKDKIPKKHYTFENWWNGEVALVYSTIYSEKGDDPLLVKWEDFYSDDVTRIKEKQKELFNEQVKNLLNPVILQFIERYKFSKIKSLFLKSEIKQCKEVMFGKIPNNITVHLNQWKIRLDNQYLSDIQYFVERTIKNGIQEGFDFIHSPNCKYQDRRNPDSRIYAMFVWEYFVWIKEFELNEKPKSNEASTSFKSEKVKSEQSKLYFQVGILFANGEMDRLIEKHKKDGMANYTAIARELGNKSFRPYISESMSGANNSDKNIFANKTKLNLIKEYCKSNGITVVDSFNDRIVEE